MNEPNSRREGIEPFQVDLKELRSISTISVKREQELGSILVEARNGRILSANKIREAEHELLVSHLPLVVSKAKAFQKKVPHVEIEDLVQAGNLGLVEAAKRFDPSKGARFSTYASHWIRKFMVEEYQKTRWTIMMPDNIMRRISRKNKLVNGLFYDLGREPTFQELADTVAKDLGLTVREAEAFVQSTIALEEEVLSLDIEVGEEQETRLIDFIVDCSVPAVDQSLEDILRSDALQESLLTLTPREASALERRFGFTFGSGDGEWRSLAQVGRESGVTRERARSIGTKALRKLRHPTRARKLIDHLL